MGLGFANAAVALLGVYLGLGALFAAAFHLGGIARVDADAARGTWGFRVAITPGAIALWPLLARRWWLAAGAPPEPRDAHSDASHAGAAP